MPGKTKISWATDTWNPTTGCDRVSPGCDNCYALDAAGAMKKRGVAAYQRDGDSATSGPGFGLSMHEDRLDQPLRWTRARTIFVNSMSDLFHEEVTTKFIAQVFAVMALCPQHTFQILTKRPQRMARLLNSEVFSLYVRDAGRAYQEDFDVVLPLPNVWLGVSVENERYTFRANHLRATPAAVRFLSCEPLLGALTSLDVSGLDWIIVGGESGPRARPMHPAWVYDIQKRCKAAGVAFFFKQWGAWAPRGRLRDNKALPVDTEATIILNEFGNSRGRAGGSLSNQVCTFSDGSWCEVLEKVGKTAAGNLLGGKVFEAFPR